MKLTFMLINTGDISKIHLEAETYNLLANTYYIGKPQNYIWRFLKGVKLLINFWRNPILLLKTFNIFKYRRYAASLMLYYAVAQLLDKQLVYDIIHCHFGPNGVKAVLLKDLGIIREPIITTFHGYDVNINIFTSGLKIYQQLFKKGNLYTANTTFTANKVIKLGCPANKLIKLPIGIDISKYNFQKKQLIPNQKIKIITVARLVEKKGIEYSIRSVVKVFKTYSHLEYIIIGDGDLRESLESLTVEFGVTDKVKFLGAKTQNEIRQLYAESHIFVLSSVTASNGDQEGQGLVLQEAQAMGLPVLSTLHNGIPDGVLDGISGFLVPERDVDALAEKLSYLIEHPEIWPSMGLHRSGFCRRTLRY